MSMWRMAGQCDCERPQHLPAHVVGDDPAYEASVIWLAQQARTILSMDTAIPDVSLMAKLRQALASSGFAPRSGFDSDAIAAALHSRFGAAFLNSLGIPATVRTAAGTRWPGRLLGSTAVRGERTPDVLRALLLAGLVTDGVDGLWGPAEETKAPSEPVPRGYGTRRQLGRDLLSVSDIEAALRGSEGKITVAALQLGVSPSSLAVDMQRQGIRLPLPAVTAKRLGPKLIAAVQGALRAGTPKVEIQKSFGISEWSVQLIELDSPTLRDAHREATIELQRDDHREAILLHRRLHPSAGRSELMSDCAAAFDWLRSFDGKWLEENLPKPKRARNNGRGVRKDWHKADRDCVALVQAAMRAELEKKGRPTQLTATRLLSAAGALTKRPSRLPLTVAETDRCSESQDAFLRRKIAWALNEYLKRHVPISMNQLRRAAGLPPDRLKQHADYIVETATALGLTFDARCALSPL